MGGAERVNKRVNKTRKFWLRAGVLTGAGTFALMAFAGYAATKGAKPATASAAPAAAAVNNSKQVVTGPIAQYWVDTTTSSGMSLGAMSGGGRPSMGSIMNMMKGGTNHSLLLRLGSSQAPTAGDPAADHLPPQALQAGNDLPLYYKAPKETHEGTYTEHETQTQQETPKGKILIFWGCGEHAPKDQPVVIDLSKLVDPTQRMAMVQKMMPSPISLDVERPPSPDRFKTYGAWPNEKSRTAIGQDSSLVGAHTVKGNYSPEIDFTLDQNQDYLPPITVTGNQKDQDGAVPLSWQQIAAARGFFASAIGAGGDDGSGGNTIVMWTSAAHQLSAMGLALGEYITPHDAERLVRDKVLLPGDASTCTVPAEVAGATKAMMYSLSAYGGEANFAYPPRPEDPNKPWNIQWTTKVRYRSTTGGILGQTMGGGGGMFGGGGDSGSSSSGQGDQQKKKKSGFGIGDMLKQGAGMLGGG